ncbi:hypothetical protein JYQ62_15605 [Nostoc sp. UHCC 0702]|nr:hypothetical protein JYQ62_15605 [Nostoc sp. UHCC 0702]
MSFPAYSAPFLIPNSQYFGLPQLRYFDCALTSASPLPRLRSAQVGYAAIERSRNSGQARHKSATRQLSEVEIQDKLSTSRYKCESTSSQFPIFKKTVIEVILTWVV